MNYLVAPRNYDRDFGGRTPGFGDMDEYGLPRDMSPEDKREVLDRFPLPGGGRGEDPRGPSITPGSNPMGVSTEMRGLDEFKKGLDEVNSFMRIYEMLDPRGKQDALKHLLFRPADNFDIRKQVYRPGIDKVDIEKPVYRPGIDKFDIQPLTPPETGKRDFLYQHLEQNKEVMGPKSQMFGRYANPDDGTLNNDEMAQLDPTGELLLRSLRRGEIGPLTDPNIQKAIRDLERQKYNRGRASSMDGDLMAGMPRYIRGHQYAPRGVIMTVPDIDSRIFNERVKRGYVPMTPPPSRGAGPQLPEFV